MRSYQAFGLLLQSSVEVPGGLPASLTGQPDLRIANGVVQAALGGRQLGPYTASADGLTFTKSGVAQYLCRDGGRTITIDPVPSAAELDISSYLIATAIPAALWLRGEVVLHGGAAVLPGRQRAIVLLGASGSGKSTVLKALVDAGGSIAAEDSVCLRASNGRYSAAGLPACLFLREPGAALSQPRQRYDVPARQQLCRADIAAIVVLQQSSATGSPAIRRAGPLESFEAVVRHLHRGNVPRLMGATPALLPRLAAIARSVPVYFAETPHGQTARIVDAFYATLQDG